MERFKNILLVAGGKDGGLIAVTRAAVLSKLSGAHVSIVDVIDPLPPIPKFPGIEEAELHEHLVAPQRSELELLAESLRQQGIEVKCELLPGSAAEEIVQCVIRDRKYRRKRPCPSQLLGADREAERLLRYQYQSLIAVPEKLRVMFPILTSVRGV